MGTNKNTMIKFISYFEWFCKNKGILLNRIYPENLNQDAILFDNGIALNSVEMLQAQESFEKMQQLAEEKVNTLRDKMEFMYLTPGQCECGFAMCVDNNHIIQCLNPKCVRFCIKYQQPKIELQRENKIAPITSKKLA